VVYAAGAFAELDASPPPPAMPDWSPVRTFGGYGAWGARPDRAEAVAAEALAREAAGTCGCAAGCGVHGHAHATAWSAKLPVADLRSFWGALGCACWAV
jgi:hypothetical protein